MRRKLLPSVDLPLGIADESSLSRRCAGITELFRRARCVETLIEGSPIGLGLQGEIDDNFEQHCTAVVHPSPEVGISAPWLFLETNVPLGLEARSLLRMPANVCNRLTNRGTRSEAMDLLHVWRRCGADCIRESEPKMGRKNERGEHMAFKE